MLTNYGYCSRLQQLVQQRILAKNSYLSNGYRECSECSDCSRGSRGSLFSRSSLVTHTKIRQILLLLYI
jgi:hypothetical protein